MSVDVIRVVLIQIDISRVEGLLMTVCLGFGSWKAKNFKVLIILSVEGRLR